MSKPQFPKVEYVRLGKSGLRVSVPIVSPGLCNFPLDNEVTLSALHQVGAMSFGTDKWAVRYLFFLS